MTKYKLYQYIDHTLLNAYATWDEIQTLCEEAIAHKTATVCVPPCYVRRIRDKYKERVSICTVVGFPLGINPSTAKMVEARQALADGAREVDMMINVTDVKNGLYNNVYDEIRLVREAIGDLTLKVIVETCYLTDKEKVKLCDVVSRAGADYIKTSTGFGDGGATYEDVKLFKKHLGAGVKIKASGGISTKAEAEKYILLGCSRIGSSKAVAAIHADEGKR
ncbi:MAG: deoxyribose-phosphate aldolase [Clostridiales Family XIII bacterium]|jgi:deoxyribose-phosphate aldolase|nr:deoxyribose-phosphate aldolase [Clostridiales Family XIII bacterium]